MEFFTTIWDYVITIVGGLSLTTILIGLIYIILKGIAQRTINKINIAKLNEDAVNKAVAKVKTLSFTQSIQPLVESELKKVTETANEYIKKALADTQAKYDKLLAVLENLSAYFDTSYFISEETKENLKEAIAEAKTDTAKTEQVITITEPTEETPKGSEEPKETTISIDR